MNPRVLEAINRQINSELSASYSYLAMSAYCECQKFTGAARWLRLQSQEENMHAMKLIDFVLAEIEKPLDDAKADAVAQAAADRCRCRERGHALPPATPESTTPGRRLFRHP